MTFGAAAAAEEEYCAGDGEGEEEEGEEDGVDIERSVAAGRFPRSRNRSGGDY